LAARLDSERQLLSPTIMATTTATAANGRGGNAPLNAKQAAEKTKSQTRPNAMLFLRPVRYLFDAGRFGFFGGESHSAISDENRLEGVDTISRNSAIDDTSATPHRGQQRFWVRSTRACGFMNRFLAV